MKSSTLKQQKKGDMYLSTPLALVLGLVVLVIILSVFFGLKGSGLFGKIGETTQKSLGALTIGTTEIQKVSINVPKEFENDYNMIINKFNSSKGQNCYILLDKLEGLKTGESNGLRISFDGTSGGTRISIQAAEKGAVLEVRGKSAVIKDIYPCIVFGNAPNKKAYAENFIDKYRDGNVPKGPTYANVSILLLSPNGNNGDFGSQSGQNGRIYLGKEAILFKPEMNRTCFVPVFDWVLEFGNAFKGAAGTPGLDIRQIGFIIAGEKKYGETLPRCS